MNWLRAAAIAVLLALAPTVGVQAQDISLTSRDGMVGISGTLLGHDGEFYRVDTQFGVLTVDASGVTCDGPACPGLTDFVAEITLTGESTISDRLMPALLEGFAAQHEFVVSQQTLDSGASVIGLHLADNREPLARFTLRTASTDQGIAELLQGEADIAMALRELNPSERFAALDAGLGDLSGTKYARLLALDAVVPVVAANNLIRSISPADLAGIVAGDISNWAELGGADAPIALHLPNAGTGLMQAIERGLLAPAALKTTAAAVRHAGVDHLSKAVAGDPFAIGITSFAERGVTRVLELSGTCGFSISATRRTVKSEDYPMNAPMFLYLPARRLPKIIREFLAYSRSPAAQVVIRQAGFIDQSAELIDIGAQGNRLANAIAAAGPEIGIDDMQRMIATLRPARRLTTSFRFEPGSSRPDAQSRANIVQLARALETGMHDGKTLLFVGFSDGEGPAASNARIARKRAQSVRNAVLTAVETTLPDSVSLKIEAFGEALPMACDDSAWGRKVNRRVEVWVQ